MTTTTGGLVDVLATRSSPKARSLGEPGPAGDDLDRILSAGLRVPDHGKLAPWRIQVVGPAGRAALADLCEQIYRADHPDASDSVVAIERERPLRAPVLLAVSSRLDRSGRIREIEQLLSGGAVCQNLLTAAHALGYAGQWLTGWPAYSEPIKAALGVPAGDHLLGWIHLGTALEPAPERPRPALADVVSVWDGPAGAATA